MNCLLHFQLNYLFIFHKSMIYRCFLWFWCIGEVFLTLTTYVFYLSISHFSMSAAERRHMVYTSITMSDEGDWISDDFPFDDDSASATSHPMVSWYITMLLNTKHAITSNRLRLYGFVHGFWTWLKTHIN